MVPAHHEEEANLVDNHRELSVVMGNTHGFGRTIVESPSNLPILEHGVGDGVLPVGDADNNALCTGDGV